jgi:hypothetical protein
MSEQRSLSAHQAKWPTASLLQARCAELPRCCCKGPDYSSTQMHVPVMKQQQSATVVAVAASACVPGVQQVVLVLQLANLHSPFIQLLLQLPEKGLIHDTAASRTRSSCNINSSTCAVLLRH